MFHALRFAPLALLSAVAAAAQPANPSTPEHREHIIKPLVVGGVLKGSDVLYGDPTKAGSFYVMRIHNYGGMIAPPHWHPEDEHIVVIKGRWFLGHGDTFDRSRLRALNVGDYALVPKRMNHFGWADGEIVIQVHGIGPFTTNFVSEWKMLSDPKAAASFKFKENQKVLSSRGPALVRFGARSARDRITQYMVEKPDGEKFFALENELKAIRQSLRRSLLTAGPERAQQRASLMSALGGKRTLGPPSSREAADCAALPSLISCRRCWGQRE